MITCIQLKCMTSIFRISVDSFIIDSRTMHNKYQWQWAFNEQLLLKYMLYTYTHITNCEILNINKVIDD